MPPELVNDYLRRILTAQVYDVAIRTPLQPAPKLSRRLGQEILLKREDLQPIFSFKLRGAYNHMANLSRQQMAKGVIAVSAGNHAQGVALAAQRLDINARIIMPKTTPEIKINAVRQLGAEVCLFGDDYDSACAHAYQLSNEYNRHFVHPFDDPDVIAGQGTIAMELIQQCQPPPDVIFVPVGGGGLIAGIAAYLKGLNLTTKIIGVEPRDAATLDAALKAGRRVDLAQIGLFTDGVAVKKIGKHPFDIARRWVDEVVLVSVDEVCTAMRDIFDETRALVEPAGALAVAGMTQYAKTTHGRQRWVGINSGANINFNRLAHVIERCEIGAGDELLLGVTIPEERGSFLRFCRCIGQQVISEFNYRYSGPTTAQVFVGLRLGEPKQALLQRLTSDGYMVEDYSDNELAKLHIRHLVGGSIDDLEREVLYRFEFPERPNALLDFLTVLASRWNISLFHYRNHGAAYGRVLVGFTLQAIEQAGFEASLDVTGYRWFEETNNPAYRSFLNRQNYCEPVKAAVI